MMSFNQSIVVDDDAEQTWLFPSLTTIHPSSFIIIMNQQSIFERLTRNISFARGPLGHKAHPQVREVGAQHTPTSSRYDDDDDDDEKDDDPEKRDSTDAQLRKRLKIKAKNEPTPLLVEFGDLSKVINMEEMEARRRCRQLLLNIENSRFKEPTPIQMQGIPCLLNKRHVMGIAPTGSGKTATFLIPIIVDMMTSPKSTPEDIINNKGIHALILVPTHELGDQIMREFSWLAHGSKPRACTLNKTNKEEVVSAGRGETRLDLLVSTPLMLAELIEERKLESQFARRLRFLIMDEADRLLDAGFLPQIDTLLSFVDSVEENEENVGKKCLRALFSATMPPNVESLASAILSDPVSIWVGPGAVSAPDTITQELVYAGNEEGKAVGIRRLLAEGKLRPPCLLFVETRERAEDLRRELRSGGAKRVEALHSGQSPAARDAVITAFRSGEAWFLVATEVLARGVDFRGVNTVVNYDFPLTAVSYIHRIGRCGRAGRTGSAITFFTDDDVPRLRPIANVVRSSGFKVEEWMLQLKRPLNKEDRRREKSFGKRKLPGLKQGILESRAKIFQEGEAKKRRKQKKMKLGGESDDDDDQ